MKQKPLCSFFLIELFCNLLLVRPRPLFKLMLTYERQFCCFKNIPVIRKSTGKRLLATLQLSKSDPPLAHHIRCEITGKTETNGLRHRGYAHLCLY